MNIHPLEEQLQKELQSWIPKRPCALRFLQWSIENNEKRKMSRKLEQEVKSQLLSVGVHSHLLKTSVSHSFSAFHSSILVIGSDQSIGVDLELTQRKIHAGVGPRIIHPNEQKFKLQVIEYWVIKEAAFKSYSSNQNTYLPQYVLTQWDPSTHEGEVSLLSTSAASPKSKDLIETCRIKLLSAGPWTIAFAQA